jgi:adenosylhomocysteine nucleosidase
VTGASARRVGVLAAMRPELNPFARALSLRDDRIGDLDVKRGAHGDVEIVATLMGMGTANATHATTRLLDAVAVDRVIVIGVAGGIGASVKVRELVVPEVVVDAQSGSEHRPAPIGGMAAHGKMWTSDELIVDRAEFDRLEAAGVIALDMETAAVAAVCEAREIPWVVVRGLSDHVNDSPVDKAIFGLAKMDGSPDVGAVVRYVVTKPWKMPRLARMGRDMNAAMKASIDAARVALQ